MNLPEVVVSRPCIDYRRAISTLLLDQRIEALSGLIIKKIEGDYANWYYITEDGEVYVSGGNSTGELGLGHMNKIDIPIKNTKLNGIKITDYLYIPESFSLNAN